MSFETAVIILLIINIFVSCFKSTASNEYGKGFSFGYRAAIKDAMESVSKMAAEKKVKTEES